MAWTKPQYTRGQVDGAGRVLAPPGDEVQLVSDKQWDDALYVIGNWRAAHAYPLLAMRMTLTKRARQIDERAIVAQRLKRLSSIQLKLLRNKNMALSQMQDIGGCRAVMRNVIRVDKLVERFSQAYSKNPHVRAEFVRKYDYIYEPKEDGYRSVHLIYKYRTKSNAHLEWNGLRIEIQLRSRLQHAWATAVETVDTFTHQSLKTGGGKDQWRRFFELMGSATAIMERRPLCPSCPATVAALKKELREYVHALNVRTVLRGWSKAMNYIPGRAVKGGAAVYLLYMDAKEEQLKVTGFSNAQQARASDVYLSTEKMIKNNLTAQAVLVSTASIQTLRTAFPNYFADTRMFINAVNQAVVLS